MTPQQLKQFDAIARAARLVKASELTMARERSCRLQDRDPDGSKLEAFTAGVIDAMCEACGPRCDVDALRLVAYIVRLLEPRPDNAFEAAEQAHSYAQDPELSHYVGRGRQTALRILRGDSRVTGAYAEAIA